LGDAVTDLPAPPASRLRRARWSDPRLLVGIFLVLVSVAAGAKVLADADDRVRVWSVTRDLGVGATLTDDDVEPVAVRLDDRARRYVSAGQDLEGAVLTRAVGRGELLPLAAVGRTGDRDIRQVVIEVDRVGVAGLEKGRLVDVYAVRTADGEEPAAPELVLAGVTVGEDVRGGDGFGAGSTAGVTLLVDRSDVPAVIDAVANGAVYLVAVPGDGTPS
jgi:hypothetical protein